MEGEEGALFKICIVEEDLEGGVLISAMEKTFARRKQTRAVG